MKTSSPAPRSTKLSVAASSGAKAPAPKAVLAKVASPAAAAPATSNGPMTTTSFPAPVATRNSFTQSAPLVADRIATLSSPSPVATLPRLAPRRAGAVLLSAALRALFYRGPILNGGWDV